MPRAVAALALLAALARPPAAAPPAGPTTAAVRPDGALVVNGKPVFPVGFYISSGHTGESRLKGVELIHGAGGNVVHIEGPWHEDTRFLDKAAELGVHVVAGHTETEAKLGRVAKYQSHPAIIAWTLYDDANTKSNVPHLAAMNKLVKAAAPDHLTFIPLGTQNRAVPPPDAGFYACADVIGWENYPVANPKAADPSLKATETMMAAVAAAARAAGRPVWLLPQAFAWPGGRVPTPAEYRNLCYAGVVNNAKGVMAWSLTYGGSEADPGNPEAGWPAWSLPDSRPLWAEAGAVCRELTAVAPLLLGGRYAKLTSGGDVTAAAWVTPTETLVVVVNLDERRARPVRLMLPAGAKPDLTPVFPGRPATLAGGGGLVTGDIGPAEVQVYRAAK